MANLNGTAGNDVLVGDDTDSSGAGGDDTVHGGAGDDIINGRGGNNQLFGDDGDDTFRITTGSLLSPQPHGTIDGGAGFNTIDLTGSDVPLIIRSNFVINQSDTTTFSISFPSGDTINAKNIQQVLLGDHGLIDFEEWTHDIKIVASPAGSYVLTGSGNDTFVGSLGNDQVYYEGGSDRISLGDGDNTLEIDHVSGQASSVIASAGTGHSDRLAIGPDVLLNGPANFDLQSGVGFIGSTTFSVSGFEYVLVSPSAHVSVCLGNDDANNIAYQNGSVLGGFVFAGRGGDDTISGGLSDDQLRGDDGNDVLSGGGGNNLIDGGAGNDYIEGGGHNSFHAFAGDPAYYFDSGADTISGGAGNDHIWGNRQVAAAGGVDGADSIDGGDGNDYINGNAGADTIHGGTGSDRLYGGADDDLLYGEIGNDHINGNKGNDTIDGGAGADELLGGQGADQLYGGDGNDTVVGDAGADTIHGDAGADVLTGGADADVFAFSAYGPLSLSPAPLNASGPTDVVTDYQDGTDKFSLGFTPAAVLAGSAATSAAAATVAQQLFDGHAGDHEVAAIQVGADTYLFFSAIGGGGVDSEVQVVGVAATAFGASDFV